MSIVDLLIRVRETGARVVQGRIKGLATAQDQVSTSGKRLSAQAGLSSRAMQNQGKATANVTRQFGAQAAGLGGLVAAYAGAAANIFAVTQAFSALSRAAEAEQVIAGTRALAAVIGESSDQILADVEKITKAQLTLVETAQQVNIALSAGFNSEQIERLAEVALKASRALGRNLADAFNRLVRGTAKLEPELLDELGIFTRIEPAAEAYAATLGRTAASLTTFEKRQAFVNAAIIEGERKFASINVTAPTASESIEKLGSTIINLGTDIGIFVTTKLAPMADFFSDNLPAAISLFGLIANTVLGKAIGLLSTQITKLAISIGQAGIAFSNFITGSSQKALIATANLQEQLKGLSKNFTGLRGEARRTFLEVDKNGDSFIKLAQTTRLTATQTEQLIKINKAQIIGLKEVIDTNQKNLDSLKKTDDGYKKLNDRIDKQRDELTKLNTIVNTATTSMGRLGIVGRTVERVFQGVAVVFTAVARSLTTLIRFANTLLIVVNLFTLFGTAIAKFLGKADQFNAFFAKIAGTLKEFLGFGDSFIKLQKSVSGVGGALFSALEKTDDKLQNLQEFRFVDQVAVIGVDIEFTKTKEDLVNEITKLVTDITVEKSFGEKIGNNIAAGIGTGIAIGALLLGPLGAVFGAIGGVLAGSLTTVFLAKLEKDFSKLSVEKQFEKLNESIDKQRKNFAFLTQDMRKFFTAQERLGERLIKTKDAFEVLAQVSEDTGVSVGKLFKQFEFDTLPGGTTVFLKELQDNLTLELKVISSKDNETIFKNLQSDFNILADNLSSVLTRDIDTKISDIEGLLGQLSTIRAGDDSLDTANTRSIESNVALAEKDLAILEKKKDILLGPIKDALFSQQDASDNLIRSQITSVSLAQLQTDLSDQLVEGSLSLETISARLGAVATQRTKLAKGILQIENDVKKVTKDRLIATRNVEEALAGTDKDRAEKILERLESKSKELALGKDDLKTQLKTLDIEQKRLKVAGELQLGIRKNTDLLKKTFSQELTQAEKLNFLLADDLSINQSKEAVRASELAFLGRSLQENKKSLELQREVNRGQFAGLSVLDAIGEKNKLLTKQNAGHVASGTALSKLEKEQLIQLDLRIQLRDAEVAKADQARVAEKILTGSIFVTAAAIQNLNQELDKRTAALEKQLVTIKNQQVELGIKEQLNILKEENKERQKQLVFQLKLLDLEDQRLSLTRKRQEATRNVATTQLKTITSGPLSQFFSEKQQATIELAIKQDNLDVIKKIAEEDTIRLEKRTKLEEKVITSKLSFIQEEQSLQRKLVIAQKDNQIALIKANEATANLEIDLLVQRGKLIDIEAQNLRSHVQDLAKVLANERVASIKGGDKEVRSAISDANISLEDKKNLGKKTGIELREGFSKALAAELTINLSDILKVDSAAFEAGIKRISDLTKKSFAVQVTAAQTVASTRLAGIDRVAAAAKKQADRDLLALTEQAKIEAEGIAARVLAGELDVNQAQLKVDLADELTSGVKNLIKERKQALAIAEAEVDFARTELDILKKQSVVELEQAEFANRTQEFETRIQLRQFDIELIKASIDFEKIAIDNRRLVNDGLRRELDLREQIRSSASTLAKAQITTASDQRIRDLERIQTEQARRPNIGTREDRFRIREQVADEILQKEIALANIKRADAEAQRQSQLSILEIEKANNQLTIDAITQQGQDQADLIVVENALLAEQRALQDARLAHDLVINRAQQEIQIKQNNLDKARADREVKNNDFKLAIVKQETQNLLRQVEIFEAFLSRLKQITTKDKTAIVKLFDDDIKFKALIADATALSVKTAKAQKTASEIAVQAAEVSGATTLEKLRIEEKGIKQAQKDTDDLRKREDQVRQAVRFNAETSRQAALDEAERTKSLTAGRRQVIENQFQTTIANTEAIVAAAEDAHQARMDQINFERDAIARLGVGIRTAISDNLAQGIRDLNQAIFDGTLTQENFKEGVKNMFIGILDDVQKQVTEILIVEPIKDILGSVFATLTGIELDQERDGSSSSPFVVEFSKDSNADKAFSILKDTDQLKGQSSLNPLFVHVVNAGPIGGGTGKFADLFDPAADFDDFDIPSLFDAAAPFDDFEIESESFFDSFTGFMGQMFDDLIGKSSIFGIDLKGIFGDIFSGIKGGAGGLLGGILNIFSGAGGGGGGGALGGIIGLGLKFLPLLFASGGIVQQLQGGGPPKSGRDSVPALLEPGEFVIRKTSAERIGLDSLRDLNATGKVGRVAAPELDNSFLGLIAGAIQRSTLAGRGSRDVDRTGAPNLISGNIGQAFQASGGGGGGDASSGSIGGFSGILSTIFDRVLDNTSSSPPAISSAAPPQKVSGGPVLGFQGGGAVPAAPPAIVGGRASLKNVVVNLNNQGTPQETAEQPSIDFDGEKFIIDVILRDLGQNGPIRQTMRGKVL